MSEERKVLPDLSEDYRLSEDQIKRYQQNGHIYLKQVVRADEIEVYQPIISQFVQNHNYHDKPVHERDTYGKAFIQIGNLWEYDQDIRRFVMARRFAKLAADLMGVEGVRIYHDQALFKEPGGGYTPWHQDQIYWPLDTMNTITMWVPLVDVSAEMGTMTFASQSHQRGYVSKAVISDESHKTLHDYIQHKQMDQVNYGSMQAGDATFHAGWTIHSAPGNQTDKMREVMTIIYMADQTKALEPDSNARRNDLQRWLPGIKPGQVADSPLNPLVYSKASFQR